MDATREISRTYEEMRDKYLYLVYRIHKRYSLAEDALADLTITYCEYIQRNLSRTDIQWAGRLQSTLVHRARQLLKEKAQQETLVEVISLKEVIGTWEDVSPDACEMVIESLYHDNLHSFFTDLLQTLHDREQRVLELRYSRGKTLAECATICDRSKERIRQIEMKAVRKLCHPARLEKIRAFMFPVSKNDELSRAVAGVREGSTLFEVHRAPEDSCQYVLKAISALGVGYLHDGGSPYVGPLVGATRYSSSMVPVWVAENSIAENRQSNHSRYFNW